MSGFSCTCRADIETKLTERFVETAPDATGHKVRLQGYAYAMNASSKVGSGGIVERPFMPYKAEAVHPLKKGGTKAKASTGNMFFSYCPFCGKKGDT